MPEQENVVDIGGQPPKQVSFKESLLINLNRNRTIIQDNLKTLEKNLKLVDKAIDLANRSEDVIRFAESMGELQHGQQAPRNPSETMN